MTHPLSRRDFLHLTVVSAAAAGATGPLSGCGDGGSDGDDGFTPEDTLRVFPQGVASGDPGTGSVILWTRVETGDEQRGDDVDVMLEVALDEAFEMVVASDMLTAASAADHTVRVKVTDLEPFTKYHYRFEALSVGSDVGQTKTAPEADADQGVRFAFASCQDYIGRRFHAYRALTELEDPVDFVVHLGDYIYETDGDPMFQTPDGEREIELPDGLDVGDEMGTTKAAQTLADYRALYKQYRSDPDLKRAHQLYPFICVWDDHEFANDSWQDHSTHFSDAMGDEQETEQREVANQAWFEFQPADVEYDEAAGYPDDIRIYRNLRFGKHMELVMTDLRYYRSDHVVPEGPIDSSLAKLTENTSVGSRIFVPKPGFDPLEAASGVSMLGETQKAWLLDTLKASDATWKVWGSEVQTAQMSVDLSSFEMLPDMYRDLFYLNTDQWDGYRSERAEVFTELQSAGVENLVTIVGDIHAFYASELHPDFDAPGDVPIGVEFTTAGISSQAIKSSVQGVVDTNPTFQAVGLGELVPRFDELLQLGSPHYKYLDSEANGIAVADVSAERIDITFIAVGDVRSAEFDEDAVTRAQLRVEAGTSTIEVL